MNVIDLVAIVPFYISIILSGSSDSPLHYIFCPRVARHEDHQQGGHHDPSGQWQTFSLNIPYQVRVMRILRIFKMVRHFVGLQSILYTLHEAWKELGIIMLVVTITMLIFSSLLFAFEQSGPIAESW